MQMKRTASSRVPDIILAAAISICSATFAWAEGTFLAVFVFGGKAWKEVDRIDYIFPVSRSTKPQMKLLTPDKTGNEGCCFYQEYIMSSKEAGADGIVFVPTISQYLHGARLVYRAFSYGAQIDDGMPPYEMESENIGHPWPDRLLHFKANIERKLDLMLEPNH